MMKTIVKTLILLVLVMSSSLAARAEGEVARNESKIDITRVRTTLYDQIARLTTWTIFKELSSVKIEYKFQECNSTVLGGFKNLNMVFFKFTNRTSKNIEVSYMRELYFDGECSNCDKLDRDDNQFTVALGPNEVKEGNCDSQERGLSIPANFIKLVQGMSGTELTDFKLINLETKVIK
jgi:hypothetical protein